MQLTAIELTEVNSQWKNVANDLLIIVIISNFFLIEKWKEQRAKVDNITNRDSSYLAVRVIGLC